MVYRMGIKRFMVYTLADLGTCDSCCDNFDIVLRPKCVACHIDIVSELHFDTHESQHI